MYNSKTNEQIRDLLNELAEYAMKKGMKSRVRDSIEEIKKKFHNDLSQDELYKEISAINELLEYVKSIEGRNEKSQTELFWEEMKLQVESVLQQCAEQNKMIKNQMFDGQIMHINQAEREMYEIVNTESSFNEIMSTSSFCDFFYKIGDKLNRQFKNDLSECVNHMCDNYVVAMQRLRGMLRQKREIATEINRRELYSQWDIRSEDIKKEYSEKIKGCVVGKVQIEEFGNKLLPNINLIIKKNMRKKSLCMMLPILIIILLIGLKVGINLMEQTKVQQENIVSMQENVTEEENLLVTQMKESIADSAGEAIGSNILPLMGSYVIPILILAIIIPEAVFIISINKKCVNRIKRDTSVYLSEQMNRFNIGEVLQKQLFEVYQQYEMEINEKYVNTFEIGFRLKKEQEEKKDELDQILIAWNLLKIQYEGERNGSI